MKIFVVLQIVLCNTFLSSLTFSDNLNSYYALIKKDTGMISFDDVAEDTIITKVKNIESSVESQPDIFFDESVYNFGEVYINEEVDHVFVFQNRGTKDLIIKEIKASCGCMVLEESTKTIQPGMYGTIDVIFRSDPYPGTVNETIRVYSNDINTPVYSLKLLGETIEDITINPKYIRFGYVSEGEKSQVKVEIQPRSGFNLEVKDVISSNPFVSIKYEKYEDKNKYVAEATLKETAAIGVLKGNIHILTNSEKQSKVVIPFSGEVLGDIRLYPTHLYFGAIKKDSECVKSVFITLLKKKIKIEKIEVQPDFLVLEIITDPRKDIGEERHEILSSNFWEASTNFSQKNILEKNNVPLRILTRINENAPVGEIEGVLKVYTNSKIQPIINIPVSAEIID